MLRRDPKGSSLESKGLLFVDYLLINNLTEP